MRDIPNSALILGLAGLVPFFWGVATSYDPVLHNLSLTWLSERYTGSSVNLIYGTIILAFMSGVLWGFSANVSDKRRPIGLILSVLPALWAFFTFNGQDLHIKTMETETAIVAGIVTVQCTSVTIVEFGRPLPRCPRTMGGRRGRWRGCKV